MENFSLLIQILILNSINFRTLFSILSYNSRQVIYPWSKMPGIEGISDFLWFWNIFTYIIEQLRLKPNINMEWIYSYPKSNFHTIFLCTQVRSVMEFATCSIMLVFVNMEVFCPGCFYCGTEFICCSMVPALTIWSSLRLVLWASSPNPFLPSLHDLYSKVPQI